MGAMPARDRVLNGHVVAFYALRLAGLSVTECSQIVGTAPARLKKYILPGWWDRTYRPRTRWHGDALNALAGAYADHSLGVREIIVEHHITQASLYKLAQKHRWPRRPMGPKIHAAAVRRLSSGRLAYYKKLRASGVPLAEALLATSRGAQPIHSAGDDPNVPASAAHSREPSASEPHSPVG